MTDGFREERAGRGIGTVLGAAFFVVAGAGGVALGITSALVAHRRFDAVMAAFCVAAGVGMLGVGLAALRRGRVTVTRGAPGLLLVGLVAAFIVGGIIYDAFWLHQPLVDWSQVWKHPVMTALVLLLVFATNLGGRPRGGGRLGA